jgi:putative ABC transport system permease protein
MSVLMLAWLGLKRRPLSTVLTVLYVALGAALALVVARGQASTERSFQDAARGYDLLLAPKNGSGLQAVLATLFFVDEPAGTIPWSAYETAAKDPRVRAAVPYAMGDTFRGHRVVGTTRRHFEVLTDLDGRPLSQSVTGALFAEDKFEAVVGSMVARDSGLAVGARFQVSHGVRAAGPEHAESWRVVGVLHPTGTPQDRAIFIALDSFYEVEGHASTPGSREEPGHEPPPADRRLSAVGVRLGSPALRAAVYAEWRREHPDAQPVMPADEVLRLQNDVLGPLSAVFRGAAALVLLVGGLGILVGLYNTLQGRRREIAILRALGARPGHVFAVILLEGVLLCGLGALVGLVLGHAALAAVAPWALGEHGVSLTPGLSALDAWLFLGLLGLGALAGAFPAWRGLRTPVARNLTLEG